MSFQRRRGQPIKVYVTETVTDRRGNTVKRASTAFHEGRAWAIPQRSSRAEVPGQQIINVIRIGVSIETLTGVELWSRVEYRGKEWDLVTPPEFHEGSRHVRHFTVDLRERPTSG